MLRALRASGAVTILALSIVGPGALVAAGDDGPPRTAPVDRPTRTVLRPTEILDLDPILSAKPSDRCVVVLVSGIGSDAPDGTFDALVAELRAAPEQCEIHRFGGDRAYPYDTHGSIDASADQLTAEIRDLAKTHPKITVVAHSMGGVVVDEAFRRGLSANDKVSTYIALASPHDGSTEARTALPLLGISEFLGAKTEFRAITGAVGQDVGSDAVRDLASVHAGPPPAGITRVDLREATDAIVIAPDSWTPGVTSRTLLPSTIGAIEGHGGVTTDPRAIALVMSTIANGRPPALDLRGVLLAVAAGAVSGVVTQFAPPAYLAIGAVLLCCAFGLAMVRRRRARQTLCA